MLVWHGVNTSRPAKRKSLIIKIIRTKTWAMAQAPTIDCWQCHAMKCSWRWRFFYCFLFIWRIKLLLSFIEFVLIGMNAVNRRSRSISFYSYIIYERQRSKIYFESWVKILAQIRFRIQHNILLRSAGIIPQDLACRENTFCWAKVYTKILSTLLLKYFLACSKIHTLPSTNSPGEQSPRGEPHLPLQK